MNRWPFHLPPRQHLHIPLHSTTNTGSTGMCCIWQDDKRLSWFRSERYKRPLQMYWYSALCVWMFYRCAGPRAPSRTSLGCSLSHILLCNCASQRPLCAWGTVQEIISIFRSFSSLSICECTLIHVCVCAWERLNGCCVGVFCLSISLHYVRKQRRLMWFAYYFLAIHEAWSVCQDSSR